MSVKWVTSEGARQLQESIRMSRAIGDERQQGRQKRRITQPSTFQIPD